HFVGPLALLAEKIQRTSEPAACAEFVNASAQHKNAIAELVAEGLLQVSDVSIEFAARLNDKFRGSGRSGRADVRNKISDGEIGFVADAGNDRNFALENRACNDFFVEGPKIFHRTAATSEDQNVNEFSLIEKSQCADNFFSGAVALHTHGKQRDVHVVKAALQNANDVANGGALG